GEALRRGLVRDAERVAEVLDREVLLALAPLQEVDRGALRDEAARREVRDLDALAQELRVRARALVPEDAVGDRLERERAQLVATGDRRGREVDAPVLQVGDRAGGVRQVVDVPDGGAELLGHAR